jgi:hypothetical protein
MIIDDDTVDLAVLGVFFERRTPPGGRLAWSSLLTEWRKAALRASDLDDGVGRLVARGALRWESEGGERFLELTLQGYRCGRRPGIWERPLRQLWRSLTAYRPRGRRSRRGDLASSRWRRIDD